MPKGIGYGPAARRKAAKKKDARRIAKARSNQQRTAAARKKAKPRLPPQPRRPPRTDPFWLRGNHEAEEVRVWSCLDGGVVWPAASAYEPGGSPRRARSRARSRVSAGAGSLRARPRRRVSGKHARRNRASSTGGSMRGA